MHSAATVLLLREFEGELEAVPRTVASIIDPSA